MWYKSTPPHVNSDRKTLTSEIEKIEPFRCNLLYLRGQRFPITIYFLFDTLRSFNVVSNFIESTPEC